MQVDPIKPKLKAPGTKRLKLQCDEALSNFSFTFNLHRYSKARAMKAEAAMAANMVGRCRLNLSNPC